MGASNLRQVTRIRRIRAAAAAEDGGAELALGGLAREGRGGELRRKSPSWCGFHSQRCYPSGQGGRDLEVDKVEPAAGCRAGQGRGGVGLQSVASALYSPTLERRPQLR